MKGFSHPLLDARRTAPAPTPVVERLLRGIGADRAFADDVLGDLAEERARRTRDEGAGAAQRWYRRETLRSMPHLVRNALIHGDPHARLRLALIGAALLLVPVAALAASALLPGPAARLVADGPGGVDRAAAGVIINTRRPIRLKVQAFDESGHRLSSGDARYRWVSGDTLAVTAAGVATCARSADAFVRVSLGTATTLLRVLCRPVTKVRTTAWVYLTAGGRPSRLSWRAYGPDDREVGQLSGSLHIDDSTVATLHDDVITPVAPGRARVTVRVGDAMDVTTVDVYEPVPSLRGLRPDQLLVAAPVRLPADSVIQWPLPKGEFWLRYELSAPPAAFPTFTVDGRVVCINDPSLSPTATLFHCQARDAGGSILLRNLAGSAPLTGLLQLERREYP